MGPFLQENKHLKRGGDGRGGEGRVGQLKRGPELQTHCILATVGSKCNHFLGSNLSQKRC